MSSTNGKNIFPGMTGDYLQDQKEMIEAGMREVVKEMSDHERCESRLHRITQSELEVFIVADVDRETLDALNRAGVNVGTTGHCDHGKQLRAKGMLDMESDQERIEFMIRNFAKAEPVKPIKLLNHLPNPWSKRKKGGFRKYT